jgi:hypothetical protein
MSVHVVVDFDLCIKLGFSFLGLERTLRYELTDKVGIAGISSLIHSSEPAL